MRLKIKPFDGRSRGSHDIIDEDTNLYVGSVHCDGVGFVGGGVTGNGEMHVSLFGGKYSITVHRYDECLAFIKGVEAVLHRVAMLTDWGEYYFPGHSAKGVSATAAHHESGNA